MTFIERDATGRAVRLYPVTVLPPLISRPEPVVRYTEWERIDARVARIRAAFRAGASVRGSLRLMKAWGRMWSKGF